MKYSFKTKDGKKTYHLNFGNYFLKMLSRNKGVDYTKATNGFLTAFGGLFHDVDGESVHNPDSDLTPFIDELVYVVQAGIQSANAQQGIFETPSLQELEYVLLEDLGNMEEMFKVYGEIVSKVVESIVPEGLGKGDPKQKKSAPAKKSASRK